MQRSRFWTVAVVKKSMSLASKDTEGKSGKNCRGLSILSVVVAIIMVLSYIHINVNLRVYFITILFYW